MSCPGGFCFGNYKGTLFPLFNVGSRIEFIQSLGLVRVKKWKLFPNNRPDRQKHRPANIHLLIRIRNSPHRKVIDLQVDITRELRHLHLDMGRLPAPRRLLDPGRGQRCHRAEVGNAGSDTFGPDRFPLLDIRYPEDGSSVHEDLVGARRAAEFRGGFRLFDNDRQG